MGFPGGSESKESTGNVGDLGSISGLGRFPGGGDGNRFRYSCLENPHGWRSLVSYSPWGLKESDVTKHTDRSSLGLPGGTVGKQPPASTGDTGSIPGLGRFHTPWAAKTCKPKGLRPAYLEPVLYNKRSHCSGNPAHCNEK